MSKPYRFLFTADVHGNKGQFTATFKRAKKLGIDDVIFGGDIAPKEGNEEDGPHFCPEHKTRNPQNQKTFYEDFMLPLFSDYSNQGMNIFAMMGNDDFRINMGLLQEAEEQGKFKLIHDRAYELREGLFVVGCSLIDLTPFVNKDWEKWDLSNNQVDPRAQRNRLEGYSSTDEGFLNYCTPEQGYFKVDFRKIPEEDSLEAHLFGKIGELSIPAQTVYVFHAPPYNTHLDQMKENLHVGSKAVRNFFEQSGGVLGLHGHIHETVDQSGSFIDAVGKTPVATPGNDPFHPDHKNSPNYRDFVSLLIIELDNKNRPNISRENVYFGKDYKITKIDER